MAISSLVGGTVFTGHYPVVYSTPDNDSTIDLQNNKIADNS